MSTAFTVGVASITRAATLYWDSDQNPTNGATDGSGTWSAGLATFYNPLLPATDFAAGSGDIATFGNGGVLGAPGVVNVTGAQSVGGLVFGVTGVNGYTLSSTTALR
jgi:hypothetical protein